MNTTSARYRMTLLLFAGGILVSAALVAAHFDEDQVAAPAQIAAAPEAQPVPAQWSGEEASPDDGRGKLLGHVERNGELIEVREAVAEEGGSPEQSEEFGSSPEFGLEADLPAESTQR